MSLMHRSFAPVRGFREPPLILMCMSNESKKSYESLLGRALQLDREGREPEAIAAYQANGEQPFHASAASPK